MGTCHCGKLQVSITDSSQTEYEELSYARQNEINNSNSEIKTLTTELNVERLNKIMINDKIEELRKVLPEDLRRQTRKRLI